MAQRSSVLLDLGFIADPPAALFGLTITLARILLAGRWAMPRFHANCDAVNTVYSASASNEAGNVNESIFVCWLRAV